MGSAYREAADGPARDDKVEATGAARLQVRRKRQRGHTFARARAVQPNHALPAGAALFGCGGRAAASARFPSCNRTGMEFERPHATRTLMIIWAASYRAGGRVHGRAMLGSQTCCTPQSGKDRTLHPAHLAPQKVQDDERRKSRRRQAVEPELPHGCDALGHRHPSSELPSRFLTMWEWSNLKVDFQIGTWIFGHF